MRLNEVITENGSVGQQLLVRWVSRLLCSEWTHSVCCLTHWESSQGGWHQGRILNEKKLTVIYQIIKLCALIRSHNTLSLSWTDERFRGALSTLFPKKNKVCNGALSTLFLFSSELLQVQPVKHVPSDLNIICLWKMTTNKLCFWVKLSGNFS